MAGPHGENNNKINYLLERSIDSMGRGRLIEKNIWAKPICSISIKKSRKRGGNEAHLLDGYKDVGREAYLITRTMYDLPEFVFRVNRSYLICLMSCRPIHSAPVPFTLQFIKQTGPP